MSDMPKVITSETAKQKLEKLAPDDRNEALRWCEELKAWRPDSLKFISRIIGINSTFMLRTDADTRLVFTTDTKGITKPASEITIIDVIHSGQAASRRALEHVRQARRGKQAHAS
jgi:hypothetical protein